MAAIRFYTDEDVYGSIAPALRGAGYDALSTPEAGRLGESDESQLQWAAHEGCVLVTFNVAHFTARHIEWLRHNRHHAGLVVSQQRPIRDTLRRLLRLARNKTRRACQGFGASAVASAKAETRTDPPPLADHHGELRGTENRAA